MPTNEEFNNNLWKRNNMYGSSNAKCISFGVIVELSILFNKLYFLNTAAVFRIIEGEGFSNYLNCRFEVFKKKLID